MPTFVGKGEGWVGAVVGPMIVNGLSHEIKTVKTVEVSGQIYLPEMNIYCGETIAVNFPPVSTTPVVIFSAVVIH
jgi:hypothetical protein